MGGGKIENAIGGSDTPTQRLDCDVQIRLYNIGDGFGLRLDAGTTAPKFECLTDIAESIRTKQTNKGTNSTLTFTVPNNLRHPLPGLDNAVVSTASTINGKTRNVKIKGKSRKVSLLSSVKCASKRTISVDFTDETGDKRSASTKVKC